MADNGERLRLQLVGGESRELPMEGVLTIGSATRGVDWTIDAQGVADVHCVVGRAKGGGWAVKDMGSRYGTLINGKRIKYARLAAGDQVLLGSRRMQVISLASPATITPIAPAEPVPSPLQIAGYRLERPLGHGGMGLVYLAEQESLSRKVALKILSARLSHDTDFVNRFLAEARAAAALNHPNVVTVHDVGESGGQHYLSMEYMDRGNLEARVAREGPLSWVETLRVMKDAASALVFAEGKGIVHRDIKPANLMQNSAGVTKLADLGLATHLEAEASDSGDRKIFGTPHFISPEQARGERVDSRSDLYSLGATMYRLLTGHTPFEGESTRDILRGHFSERPRPPSEWVVGLPEGLERMVMRLLEKKPDLRYPSAGVLLREVQTLRNGGEASAVRAPVEEASGHRGLKVAVVGGIAAVALLWIGLKIVGSGPGPQPPPDGPGTAHANGGAVEPGTGDGTGGDPLPVEPADPPGDDDRDMRLLEVEAENAFLKIDASLSDEQRLGPLAAIVEDFRGTTTASRASEEMREIQNRLLEREAAERARKSEHEQHLAALRGLAELEADPPRPGPALRQMLAHDLPAPLAADPEFQARRRELFVELIETSRRGLRTALELVEAMVKRGEFDLAGEALRGLQPGLDLPELPPDLALSELGELHLIAGDVRARLRELDDREETFLARRSREDARALAANLVGEAGLEGELLLLDLEAAAARLQALAGELQTDEGRALAAALLQDVLAARLALNHLADEFAAQNWQRKVVAVPQAGGQQRNREVIGADHAGLLILQGAESEHVPWSDFGGQTEALHKLFKDRLSRPYTDEEVAGIESLLRLTAVAEAVSGGDEMFRPRKTANFSAAEAREMTAPFDLVAEWSREAGRSDRLRPEAEAAATLADGLRAGSDERWSTAVVAIERLLERYGDTLLVRLLSDGRGEADDGEAGGGEPPEDASGGDAGTAEIEKPEPGVDPAPEEPGGVEREG